MHAVCIICLSEAKMTLNLKYSKSLGFTAVHAVPLYPQILSALGCLFSVLIIRKHQGFLQGCLGPKAGLPCRREWFKKKKKSWVEHSCGINYYVIQKAFLRWQDDCCLVLYLNTNGCRSYTGHLLFVKHSNVKRMGNWRGLAIFPTQEGWAGWRLLGRDEEWKAEESVSKEKNDAGHRMIAIHHSDTPEDHRPHYLLNINWIFVLIQHVEIPV